MPRRVAMYDPQFEALKSAGNRWSLHSGRIGGALLSQRHLELE